MWKYEELKKVRELVGLLCRVTRGGADRKDGWQYKAQIRMWSLIQEVQRAARMVAEVECKKLKKKVDKEVVDLYVEKVIWCLPEDILNLVLNLGETDFSTYKRCKKLPWHVPAKVKDDDLEPYKHVVAEKILLKG